MVRYHDWKGVKRQKCKRGFATRREAQEWERNFQLQTDGDPDMTFEAFLELYEHDMRPRLKENTWLSKEHMIRTKLLPTFGKKMLSEIETRDIIAWQNELLAYRDEKKQPYSPTYLKGIHNQLVAILNHAVRHYGLKSNPASKVGYIGSKEAEEMQFWTKEEYQRFAEAVMDKPMSYYAFEMLYWCGIREGELLALTPGDFDFKAGTVSISKSYQRLHQEDVITAPKTKKSIRTIRMPKFLCEEMQEYMKSLYGVKKKDRIFPVTKNYLYHEMDRGCRASGVKRIRVHDIRHPYVKLTTKVSTRINHESYTRSLSVVLDMVTIRLSIRKCLALAARVTLLSQVAGVAVIVARAMEILPLFMRWRFLLGRFLLMSVCPPVSFPPSGRLVMLCGVRNGPAGSLQQFPLLCLGAILR